MWMAHLQGTGRWEFFTENLYGSGVSVFAVTYCFSQWEMGRNSLKVYTRQGGMKWASGLRSIYKSFLPISIHLENSKAEMSHPFFPAREAGKTSCSMGVICQSSDAQLRYARIFPVGHRGKGVETETIWFLPNRTFYMGLWGHWTIYVGGLLKTKGTASGAKRTASGSLLCLGPGD